MPAAPELPSSAVPAPGLYTRVLPWGDMLPQAAAGWLAAGWTAAQPLDLSGWLVVVPTRVPLMTCRAPPAAVAMNWRGGTGVVTAFTAVPSRKTGEPTVVAVLLSSGRVIAVVGAVTAVTLMTMEGLETAVLPVSSVATAYRLNRPAVLAV